jgi:acyl-CoA thioester hydrolase
MWYVGKFDEATWNFFASLGLNRDFLRASDRGFAAVEQNIVYRKELLAGDVVTIYSSLIEARDRIVRFSHEMRKTDSDEVAASTTLTAVHLDIKTRKAAAFAPDVRARLVATIAPASAAG